MAIQTVARFIGTGRPMKPETTGQLDRSGSRQAIENTNAKRFSEFRAVNQQRVTPTNRELGRGASRAASKVNSGRTVDLTI